jgi:hypothetical protein
MPERILRPGILTSKAVNALSWPAEVFYRRLMSVCDDFGRFEADPELLRSTLYPRKLAKVTEAEIGKWLGECSVAGLLSVYQVGGECYLEVAKFGQRMRAAKSKFPAPPSEARAGADPPSSAGIRGQPHAAAAVFGDGVDTPLPPSCGQVRPLRTPWRWWESVDGVRAKAKELGLRDWDAAKAQVGEDVAWPIYRGHVFEQAGQGPWRQSGNGPTPLAEVLTKARG